MSRSASSKEEFKLRPDGRNVTRRDLLTSATLGIAVAGLPRPAFAASAPEGQLTWGAHISLAPTWFDLAETSGIITPFMVIYALHDAVLKPMPGNPMAPSLAESWSTSADGLVYEFVLRDSATAEDVKFSL